VIGDGRWVLNSSVDRRTLLKGASASALAALAAACAPATAPSPTSPPQATGAPTTAPAAPPTPPPTSVQAAPTPAGTQPTAPMAQPTAAAGALVRPVLATETVFVFNVGSRDVTLIDAAARRVRETKPLGAQVRWLSNEQTYWDGNRVWTYDFPNNRLQAIAIDPQAVAVSSTIDDIGTGPGHSLVVLPGGRRAAVNVAGDNSIALLDLASGQVDSTIKTGAFP
jgi:hypothetical protein